MARDAVKNPEKKVSQDAADSGLYCDVRGAMGIVKASEATIRRKLTSGELTRYKFGSKTLILTEQLLSLVKEEEA